MWCLFSDHNTKNNAKTHTSRNKNSKTNKTPTCPPPRSASRTTLDDQNQPRTLPDTPRKPTVFSEPPGPSPMSPRSFPGPSKAPPGTPDDLPGTAERTPDSQRIPPRTGREAQGHPRDPQRPLRDPRRTLRDCSRLSWLSDCAPLEHQMPSMTWPGGMHEAMK